MTGWCFLKLKNIYVITVCTDRQGETPLKGFCRDIEELERFIKENLKESRYRHSLGVEVMAVRLAEIYGADAEKAAFAGRYHDIAKCFDAATMDTYIRRYGLDERFLGNPAIAHSKVGAELLRNEFEVTDTDILDAVRYHTTARKGMSLLEEIVFTADVVEDNRTYPDLKYYQDLAVSDLDRCALEILEYTIGDLKSKGREIDKDTLEAYNWLQINHCSQILFNLGEQMESKKIAQAIADLLSSKKAREVVMIDIAEKSSFADYFVNATAGNERQLGALADDVADKFAEFEIEPKSRDGRPENGWILVDGGDVVVNLFTEETRQKYTLERIWNDCEMILVD